MRFFKKFILLLCLIISAQPTYCWRWDSLISSATGLVFQLSKTIYEYKVTIGALFGIFATATYGYRKYYSSDKTDANSIQPNKIIVKSPQNRYFFIDVVGMNEENFRKAYWKQREPVNFDVLQKRKWIAEYPPRAAIFYSHPETETIIELANFSIVNIGKSIAQYDELSRSISFLTKSPIFLIQFFDPLKAIESDIRWLQANPQLKNAVFQIASTFNALEGGMGKKNAKLTHMFECPVQGEYASISAAPATIRRKYFMSPFNLLYRLRDQGIEMNGDDGFESLTEQTLKKISDGSIDVSKINYKDIAVCLHNAVVTSGAGGEGYKGKFEQLPLFFKDDGTIDSDKTQIVKQVFTAAFDTRKLRKFNNGVLNKNEEDFGKLIIKASYKGTLEAACCNKEPHVFLTLMGGGSFRNEIAWIGEALEELEGFIREKGMQVVLMYRPDKPRDFSVRTAAEDITFLKKMVGLAGKINDIKYDGADSTIESYVTNAYSKKLYSKDDKEVTEAKEAYSIEAQQLQKQFPLDGFYTSAQSLLK